MISVLSKTNNQDLWEKEIFNIFFPKPEYNPPDSEDKIKNLNDALKKAFPDGISVMRSRAGRKTGRNRVKSYSGLYYLNARYYDPKRGQFLSQDPVFLAVGDNRQIKQMTGRDLYGYLSDPQGLNSYAYARNNPIRYIDPDGLFSVNPINLFSYDTQLIIGNWANNVSAKSPTLNYVTGNKWVGYTAGGVGIVAGAGAGILYAGGTLGYTALANAGSYCLFACSQPSKGDYNTAVNWVSTKFGVDPSSLPSKSEITSVMDKWVNTNMPDKTSSILYHFDKHADGGTLSQLTQNGINVWNNYVNNSQLVQKVTDSALKNGQTGIKIDLSNGAGGIFTKGGGIVTTWFK